MPDRPPVATPEGLRKSVADAVLPSCQGDWVSAEDVLRAIDAAGYAVVPKVATEEMLRTAKMRSTSQETARGDLYRGIYAAMLAAGRVMP